MHGALLGGLSGGQLIEGAPDSSKPVRPITTSCRRLFVLFPFPGGKVLLTRSACSWLSAIRGSEFRGVLSCASSTVKVEVFADFSDVQRRQVIRSLQRAHRQRGKKLTCIGKQHRDRLKADEFVDFD